MKKAQPSRAKGPGWLTAMAAAGAIGAGTAAIGISGCSGQSADASTIIEIFPYGGIPVSTTSEFVENSPTAYYPNGRCLFALLEMWQKYRKRMNQFVHPVNMNPSASCSQQVDEILTVDQMTCLKLELNPSTASKWVDKVIDTRAGLRHITFGALNWAILKRHLAAGSEGYGFVDKTGTKKSGQPVIVAVQGGDVDQPGAVLNHAVLTTFIAGKMNKKSWGMDRIRYLDSNKLQQSKWNKDGLGGGGIYTQELKKDKWMRWASKVPGGGSAPEDSRIGYAIMTDPGSDGWVPSDSDTDATVPLSQPPQ